MMSVSLPPPILVVGTGRCGSTMLSGMLRTHPRLASLSEFFSMTCDYGGRIAEIFTDAPVDGEAFWAMIGEPLPRASLVLRHRVVMPEVLYPYDDPRARFSASRGIPAILHTTLPHLHQDPDALFDELRPWVLARPEAPIGAHYRALFAWLAQRAGKPAWVERSGGAFVLIEHTAALFPDARWIHIVRDGRDTALSISRHIGFRIFILGAMFQQLTGIDPYASDDRTGYEALPPELRSFLPESFDAEAFRRFEVPPAQCAELWSTQILGGMQVLGRFPAEHVLHLRYEDFLAGPDSAQQQLERLAAFLGEEYRDPQWARAMAATVRAPTARWHDLPLDVQQALGVACEPGFERLAAAGIHYDR